MQEYPNLKKIIGAICLLVLIVGGLFMLNTYTDVFKSRINKAVEEDLFKEAQEVKDPKGSFSLSLPKDWMVDSKGGTEPSYIAFFAQSPDFLNGMPTPC